MYIRNRFRAYFLLVPFVFLVSLQTQPQSTQAAQVTLCGLWELQKSPDQRIQSDIMNETSSDCSSNLTFRNNTAYNIETGLGGFDKISLGAYTLEFQVLKINNARGGWSSPLFSEQAQKVYLPPDLTIDFYSIPSVSISNAEIFIEGNITGISQTIDLGLLILDALIPLDCLVPDHQILAAVLLNSHNLSKSAQLYVERKWAQARRELSLVLDQFIEEAFNEIGTECVLELLSHFIGVRHLELLAKALIWALNVGPVNWWVYDRKPVELKLLYAPNSPCGYLDSLNRNDVSSILGWILCSLDRSYPTVFDDLTLNDNGLRYVEYIEGSKPVTKSDFLNDISLRLPSKPHCDGYVLTDGSLSQIWTSGWQPAWELDYIEHLEKTYFEPPHQSDIVGFLFSKDENGLYIQTIWVNDWSLWEEVYGIQLIPCDLIATEIITIYPTSSTNEIVDGHCWTNSLNLSRSDAWRCMAENNIYDPCFSSIEEPGIMICSGPKIRLTEPLPPPMAFLENTHVQSLELADGTSCSYQGGVMMAIGNERVNYICSDGGFILGFPEAGQIWTATEIYLSEFISLTEPGTVEESVKVYIRRVWK